MATGANTYGTVATVQILVGDVVSGRVFTTGTTPKLADVEGMLDAVASELWAEMVIAGYPVQADATMQTGAPNAEKWLSDLNSIGAAIRVLQTTPGAAMIPSGDAPAESLMAARIGRLWASWKRGLELLPRALVDLGLSRAIAQEQTLGIGSYKDSDGNVKTPFFKRYDLDFPGSRPQTDPVLN